MNMTPQRGLLAAVSALVVAFLLLAQSGCDASRVCAADRRLDSYNEERSLRAEFEEEAEASSIHKQRFADCGQPPQDDTTFGSIKKKVLQFAPFVRLQVEGKQCGGVILSPRLILTNANCTIYVGPTLLIYLGPNGKAVKVSENYLTGGKQHVYALKKCASRPWDKEADSHYAHDFAVLKLAEDLRFSKLVHSACLPTAELAEGARAELLHFDYRSGVAEKRSVLPVERRSCGHHAERPTSSLGSRKLCLKQLGNHRPLCQSDQGSPVIALQDGKPTVFGVTNFRIQTPYDDLKAYDPEAPPYRIEGKPNYDGGCLSGEDALDVYENVFKFRAEIDKLIDRCDK